MSDQQFLDKSGLETLVGNIKEKDTELENAIDNIGNIETHLASYYYVPCAEDDKEGYEITGEDNKKYGYWKCVSTLYEGNHREKQTPVIIRNITISKGKGGVKSANTYNPDNENYIYKYTFNGEFLSKPVLIKNATKTNSDTSNSTLAVKSGTYIYTPDHIMTVNNAHNIYLIKSNHVGGIFYNNWDSGDFLVHAKYGFKQTGSFGFRTAYIFKGDGFHQSLMNTLWDNFKCSWDENVTWDAIKGELSNNSWSFGGKFVCIGDTSSILKGVLKKSIINNSNVEVLRICTMFDHGDGYGVIEVVPDKDVDNKYRGIAILNEGRGKLYTATNIYNIQYYGGYYIDEFKEAIEEIYIEPIWDDYERLLGSDFNMKSLILKKVTIAQYKGYAPSSTNPPIIEKEIPELDNDGNLTSTVKLQGVNPSGQYVTIVNFAKASGDNSIIGFFTDGIDYRNNIASGWLYYRSEWASGSDPDVGKKIGKIYIKYKTSNSIFDKKEYTIINTYDWYNIENSPHIKNYINSTKSLNEWASNVIKEIYIEKLNFNGTELSNAWQSEDQREAVKLNQYLNFRLVRVDYNYTDSEKHDGIIFQVNFRSNNMDYSFHVYIKLKNELDNIYVIENSNLKINKLRNTRRYIFKEENLSLKESWRRVSEGEGDSWYVSTSSYDQAPTVSFKIYLVLNPFYQPPYKTNTKEEKLGDGRNSYVIMEKACNITNAPTIQNYLMTKKMIEELK